MELKELIEQYKECPECFKTSNYPKEWLKDLGARKKEVFATYSTRDERLPFVNEIHNEYSDRFDDEGLEIKIPYDGSLYTLGEAEALLETDEPEEEIETSLTPEEFKANRKAVLKAKAYLVATDFKMTVDYDEDVTDIKVKRQEAREFIRENEG